MCTLKQHCTRQDLLRETNNKTSLDKCRLGTDFDLPVKHWRHGQRWCSTKTTVVSTTRKQMPNMHTIYVLSSQNQSKLEAKDVLPNVNRTEVAERAEKCVFFVPVVLTFDLQTCQTEGPNMSSVWIWCKSVQGFPEIFHTQTKKPQTDGAKNTTFRSPLHAVINMRQPRSNYFLSTQNILSICDID